MATEKQVEANRRNAQQSTGPKTSVGKDKVRFNALTHGLRARFMDVLPGEDTSEFAARLEAWNDDYQPTSAAQDHLVRQGAIISWKIDRIDRYEIATMWERVHEAVKPILEGPNHDSDSVNREFLETAAKASFDPSNEAERLRRYQFALQRALLRILDALAKLRAQEAKQKANGANEAKIETRIEPNLVTTAEMGTGTRSTESQSPFTQTASAPNKANLAPRAQVSAGSVANRTVGPKPFLHPIEASSIGWLDISCEKS